MVKKVEVEIKKPWAPIGMPLSTVSVKVVRKSHIVYLGLGSNMGDKSENIKKAIEYFNKDFWERGHLDSHNAVRALYAPDGNGLQFCYGRSVIFLVKIIHIGCDLPSCRFLI